MYVRSGNLGFSSIRYSVTFTESIKNIVNVILTFSAYRHCTKTVNATIHTFDASSIAYIVELNETTCLQTYISHNTSNILRMEAVLDALKPDGVSIIRYTDQVFEKFEPFATEWHMPYDRFNMPFTIFKIVYDAVCKAKKEQRLRQLKATFVCLPDDVLHLV